MTKKSWVFAISVVLLLEVILRIFGSYFSANIAQISGIKASIASLGSNAEGQSILFVGSSLVGAGIDTGKLTEHFQTNVRADKVVPDASNIWDWYCILKDAARDGRPFPRTVVIGYAWDQLTDQAELNINKTFGFFCGNSEIPELRRYANLNVEGVFKAAASQVSIIYMLRSAIRNNSLGMVIRNYQQTTQELNRVNYLRTQKEPVENSRWNYTYGALNLVADTVKMRGSKLIFVAMPTQGNYGFDAHLCRVAHDQELTVLDGRDIAQLKASDFRDPIHLNQAGKAKFTRALATNLAEVLNDYSGNSGCGVDRSVSKRSQ